MKYKKNIFCYILIISMMFFLALFVACSTIEDDIDEPDTSPDDTTPTATAALVSLSTNKFSLPSDNSDNAEITATVLDSDNSIIPDMAVSFSSTGGQLGGALAVTDENGQATVSFGSGSVDRSNQVVTITAQVAGVDPDQIPIQITGTAISLTGDTGLTIGGNDSTILTIMVQDAGLNPIPYAEVIVSTSSPDGGITSLSSTSGTLDGNGNFTDATNSNGTLEVTVTGTAQGTVDVLVSSMGTTASKQYAVGAVGEIFQITTPASDPHNLSTGSDVTVTASAPGITNVVFATTLGELRAVGQAPGAGDREVTIPVAAGSASARFRSTSAGLATIQVFDEDNVQTNDSISIAVSAPSSDAYKISIQASAIAVAPSTTEVQNSVTLQATVKNTLDEPVSEAWVGFSIDNPTGGGEQISPVIAFTNYQGIATTTFTSGSLSSDSKGVEITARVVGPAIPAIEDSIEIVIGGTAGSLLIGRGTVINSINNDTAYELPMCVIVADSNGNPVREGTEVTLRVWPLEYYRGRYYKPGDDWCIDYYGGGENEDKNKNLIMDEDPDEDATGGTTNTYDMDPMCVADGDETFILTGGNGDDQLTPPNSAAGTLPTNIYTDSNGVADFVLVYSKASAVWIKDEITGSTLVSGSETTSSLTFRLPYLKGEEEFLPASPFNQ